MSQKESVHVVIEHSRQDSGEFTVSVHGVWLSKSAAKADLVSMAEMINGHTHSAVERRMRHPVGQPNDWTVDILEGDFWVCHRFYEITEKVLM